MAESPHERTRDDEHALLLETFRQEAAEIFESLEEKLLEIERAGVTTADDLATIFRHFHTLKGSASCVGLNRASTFVHGIEDHLAVLRESRGRITPRLVSLLLTSIDAVRAMCRDAVAEEGALTADDMVLLERLSDVDAAAASAPLLAQGATADRTQHIRVDVRKLDKLLAIASEVAVFRARLDDALVDPDRSRDSLAQLHHDGDTLFEELQELATALRTVPVAPLFRKYGRIVRDIAAAVAKQVDLVIDADDVEVDLLIAERLSEPLTHLFRNAVDHGIEDSDTRLRAGKPPHGLLRLRSRRASGYVVIEVEDDGGGIDRARLREKAIALGLVRESEQLSDDDLLSLIFHSGFTTTSQASSLSGRGVGMDAVKQSVEGMRGRITVRSVVGAGTCVTLRLPLTLSVLRGFQVRAAGKTYVIPIADVGACFPAPAAVAAKTSGTITHEGLLHSFVNLGHFAARMPSLPLRPYVVLVGSEEARLALVVDEVIGEIRAVVRPLGRIVSGLPGIGGAAILGSGNVALVIDVPTLLSACSRRYRLAS